MQYILAVAAAVLFFVAFRKISVLEERERALRQKVADLSALVRFLQMTVPRDDALAGATPAEETATSDTTARTDDLFGQDQWMSGVEDTVDTRPYAGTPEPVEDGEPSPEPDTDRGQAGPWSPAPGTQAPVDWERLLGVKLPVWGGAAMLVIAGVLMVNWAIDAGLFTPAFRTIACALGAVLGLGAATVVRDRKISNAAEISTALATGGVFLGYGAVFLATAVFGLVPGWAAVPLGAVVTLVAIVAASTFGRPVMITGLLGGYLVPLLGWHGTFPAELTVFYVGVLFAASTTSIGRNHWKGLDVANIAGPFAWACGLSAFGLGQVLLAGLVPLLAILPMAAAYRFARDGEAPSSASVVVPVVASAVAALAHASGVGGVMPLLPVAGLALAAYLSLLVRERDIVAYHIGAAGTLAALLAWDDPDGASYIVAVLAALALLVAGAARKLSSGLAPALQATTITAVSAVSLVLLLVRLDGWAGARDIPWLWAVVALAASAAFAGLAYRRRNDADTGVPAAFAAGATGFLSAAAGLVVDPGLYAAVAALQALGLAAVHSAYRNRELRVMSLAYLGLYAVLAFVGEGRASIATYMDSPYYRPGPLEEFLPAVSVRDAMWTLLLLPALAFGAAATLFKRSGNYVWTGRAFDAATVLTAFALVHVGLLPELPSEPVRAVFTHLPPWLMAMGLLSTVAAFAGRHLDRDALVAGGLAVGAAVALTVAATAMLPMLSFWPRVLIPGPPVFNAAALVLGAPALLVALAARFADLYDPARFAWARKAAQAFAGASLLVMLVVMVRHGFHGEELGGNARAGTAELFTMSFVMLAYGFALLGAGAALASQTLRVASLVVVLLTVGKVFVFDVAGLDGLARVASFLGLGISLLAVSWFYGRFVFGLGADGRKAGEAAG